MLAVSATTSGVDATASHTLEDPVQGEALIRYRVKYPGGTLAPSGLADSIGFHLYWGTDTSKPAVSMMTDTNKQQGHRPGTSASSTKGFYPVALDQWYTVDIRLDTTKNAYSVWMDGEKAVTDATFRNDNPTGAIGTIRAAAPKSPVGSIYVDDIEIIRGPAQKVTAVNEIEPIEAAFATLFEDLPLPEKLTVTLDNGNTAELAVDWDSSSYDPALAGEQTVTGHLLTGGMYDANGNDPVSIQVTLQADTAVRDILSVVPMDGISRPLGTAENALALPESVEVTVTGDVTKTVAVSRWTCPDGYQKDKEGAYRFVGTLAATNMVTNTKGIQAELDVLLGMDEFDMLRKRWYFQIAGSNDFDANDPDIKPYLETLDGYADDALGDLTESAKTASTYQEFYDAFVKDDMVFKKQPMKPASGAGADYSKTHSSQVTMTYDRLKRLAMGYLTKGTKVYDDEKTLNTILAAMDFMYNTNKYNSQTAKPGGKPSDTSPFGNWYDWQIGTPLRYLDLLVLMYDRLTDEQVKNFTGAVNFFTPYPTHGNQNTGANKIWKCSVVAENAILMKDGELLSKVAPEVKTEMKYVTSGDGYYADGSFVQHTYFAYTGGYGKALLVTLAPVINVLNGTKYAIEYDDGAEQVFFDTIFKSYFPVIINGGVMDMVRSREISRIGGQDHVSGRQVIRAIISVTDLLEGEKKEQALSMVKYYMQQDDRHQIFSDKDVAEFFLEYYVSLGHILRGKEILEDDSIKAADPLTGYYNFADMARVVQRQADHSFGLSMYGGNIRTFEVVNEEGTNAWHTADGMLYLYNTDKEKYADHFWGAVDHQRLPGTTIDRFSKGGSDRSSKANASGAAYGGAQIHDLYGATAFQLDNGVASNKSYFFFDDEAVLLGSGITSTSGNPVETIVENYKAKLDLSNRVTVNGEEQARTESRADAFNGKHENVEYIHMEGNVDGADVGYVFPGGADVTGLRETRTQKWTLMNKYEKFADDRDVTRSFITMYLDHGTNPTDADYAYIILPGKSSEETAAYSADSDVEILANTKTVQAVRENDLGITAVNFFAAGSCEAAGVSTDKPASVLFGKDARGNMVVSVADVTNKASGEITVTLDQIFEGEPFGSDITVETSAGKTILKVDVTGSRGQTRTVTFGDARNVTKVEPLRGITVKYGTAQDDLPLPQTVTVTLDDGSTCTVGVIDWVSEPEYNGAKSGTYAFTGTLDLPDGVVNVDGLTATVSVTVSKKNSGSGSGSGSGSSSDSGSSYRPPVAGENKVSSAKSQNGTFEADTSRAKAGDTVTITTKPDAGYEVAAVTVTAQDGSTVRVTEQRDGIYTFTMPDKQVTVGVVFRPAGASPTPAVGYRDVAAGDWFSKAADYVTAKGIMSGYNGSFMPNTALNRGMIAQILYNLGGGNRVSSQTFPDVSTSDWYADAVAWVSSKGVMSGYGSGLFGAEDAITREQLAVTLYQYASVMGYDTTAETNLSAFVDGDSASNWAMSAMRWAVASGLLSGKSGGRLDPQGMATRAEVAAVLMNFVEQMTK